MEPGDVERYREFDPPPHLRPFVRTIWTYGCARPSATVQRIAPDGCPELVLHVGTPYAEQHPDDILRPQPTAVFVGQMTRPIALRPLGPVELVAVRFEPDGARDWLGQRLDLATDRRLDVADRLGGLTPPSGDPAAQVEAVVQWLDTGQRRTPWAIDPAVRETIQAMASDRSGPALLPGARRALQRRFADRVGVSPRMLRSIFRFRRVFDHAGYPGQTDTGWLEAGLGAGYFDQPQMARDFRRFLGCTATEWAREQSELARAIASQTYKSGALQLP
ncbi:helix-turn-helix domain-containing protein [Brevundimonas sp.]|uniref:AraC family transcriptional regulator n=1 Tax=Brevundimonas sp. TaxID=1871086 RepID=UPI002AB8574C|nr:helix-turn-helix domain-containing protein [Brevundimonas sp.]MDZ4361980.1 helix-turn-helix domain-containing protein [Brevundimonas sp.]